MLKQIIYSLFFLFLSQLALAQSVGELPSSLAEISGLEELNDSILVAINDGGNKAELTLIDHKGKLIKRIKVLNSTNQDWEDITRDETHLFIGDFGNNLNKRKNLCVYKVDIKSVLKNEEVSAEKINFSYAEQTEFPPAKTDLRFDCEAIVNHGNGLILFTKTNTVPWDGNSWMYRLSKTPGEYIIEKENELYVGPDGWLVDAITAADCQNDKLYISTYNRMIIFNFAENKPKMIESTRYEQVSQKEAFVVTEDGKFFFADEKHRVLGGGKLYLLDKTND